MTEKDLDALMEAVSSRLTEQKRTYFTDDVRRRLQGVLAGRDPGLEIRPKAKTPNVLFNVVLRGAKRTPIFGFYAFAKYCTLGILSRRSPHYRTFYRELRDQHPDLYKCLVRHEKDTQQGGIAVRLTSPDADSRVAAFQKAIGLFLNSLRSASTTTPASDEEDARRRSVRSIIPTLVESELPDLDLLNLTAREGRLRVVEHLRRERNRKIIQAKKKQVLHTVGRLTCEVCEFDFEQVYGQVGQGFCEVHHKVPLAASGTEITTTLEDLAILCSNCHRMVHRTNPFKSIEELRRLVTSRT